MLTTFIFSSFYEYMFNIRPLAKLTYVQGFVGDTSPRTAAYSNVREEQSTGITHKLPAEIEFCKRSIVVMNCAGWHGAKDLVVPANIEILYLPPYSPELNPAERLWEHLYASIMFSSFLIA